MKTKFKVGDWVQLVNHKGSNWNNRGEMDHYKGMIVKITSIEGYLFRFEGSDGWFFTINDIAGYAKNKIVQDIIQDL